MAQLWHINRVAPPSLKRPGERGYPFDLWTRDTRGLPGRPIAY